MIPIPPGATKANPAELSSSSRQWEGCLVVKTLLALAGFKAAYLLVVLAALLAWGDTDSGMFFRVMQRWPREGQPVFASHFATWDAAHYLYLSEVGYRAGATSCAFYPLFPELIRWFSPLTGGSHLLAGMILANLFSLVAFALFFLLVRQRLGDGMARLSLAFLLAFPGSLFYHFIYSESLFLLLLMLIWLGLERDRPALVWVAGFFLPLTRSVGIFCLVPLAWHVLSSAQPRAPGGLARLLLLLRNMLGSGTQRCASFSLLTRVRSRLDRLWNLLPGGRGVLAAGCRCDSETGQEARSNGGPRACNSWLLLAPLLGLAAYLMLMWARVGNPLEGIEAQRYWGHNSVANLFDLPKFILGFFTPLEWHGWSGSVLDRAAFTLVALVLPVIWRLDRTWFLWTLLLGVAVAMIGTFSSFTRYASVVFPLFIGLAVSCRGAPRRPLRLALMAAFVLLHATLLWRFVNFRWAG